MEIHVKHMLELKKTLTGILAKHTGKPYEEVYAACERDNFLTAEDAKEFGLVDEVVSSRQDVTTLPENRLWTRNNRTDHGPPAQSHPLQLLRQIARRSPQAGVRSGRLHLRRCVETFKQVLDKELAEEAPRASATAGHQAAR